MTGRERSSGESGDGAALTTLELWLGEGTVVERDALRRRVADDPMQALDMAETVALLEGFRQLRVEPSPHLHCKMADVMRRAERRTLAPSQRSVSVGIAWTVAAAALVLAALYYFDPLGRRVAVCAHRVDGMALASTPGGRIGDGAEAPSAVVVRQAGQAAWESTVEKMRQRLGMEGSSRLRESLEIGLQGAPDPLEQWLDPRNALALLRVEHELRNNTEVRTAALLRQGGMVAADARAQQMADLVARELTERLVLDAGEPAAADVALAVRALLATGALSPQRSTALALGSEWLAERLPETSGAEIVLTLAPLVEVAAVTGLHVTLVRSHGERLLDEVLHADEDTWGRRRPELLAGRVPAATMADASRLFGLLPGFGADAGRCRIVRELLLGQLRERRDGGGEDGPELLAAMVFGSADLLLEAERDEIERQLRRWNLTRLAPDFVTVQQLAWGMQPGRLGFTRMQRDLRRLAVLAEPDGMGPRAAFCLCLATSYAAWRVTPPQHPLLGD